MVESLNALPEIVASRSEDDEPINLVLTLNVDDEVMSRYVNGCRTGLAAMGYDVDDVYFDDA